MKKNCGKKTKKRLFRGVLALAMVGTLWPMDSIVAYASDYDGNLSENISFSFDLETWTTTISGTGALPAFNDMRMPEGVDMGEWMENGEMKWMQARMSSTLVIGEGITSIGNKAFESWSNVENVTISSTVTSIGDNAFRDTINLNSINIPDGVTSIGNKAFEYSNLGSIIIPASVTSIGDEAFKSSELSEITLSSVTPPTLGTGVFDKESWQTDNLVIYVPARSVAAYKSAWSSYAPQIQAAVGDSTHTHGSWNYTASGATLTAECEADGDCDLTDNKVSLILTASNANSSGSVTLTGTEDWAQAFGTENVPVVYYEGTGGTTYAKKDEVPTAPGVYKATITVGTGDSAVTAETTYTVYSNTYTLTVPATAEAAGAGFNAVGDVNVKGNIAGDKKIVVKASGSDNNTFKSTAVSTTVGYTIVKGNAAEYTEIPETGLVFSQIEVNKETETEAGTEKGTSVAVGIVVDETDYRNAADGDYTTTVTWKASLSSASAE